MRSHRNFIPVCLLMAFLTWPATSQTFPSSTNPSFAKYYNLVPDGGPTYAFGPSDPYPGWMIFSDAVADFLGRGTPQILLGGFSLTGTNTWTRVPVRLLVNGGNGTFSDAGSLLPSIPTPYFTSIIPVADFNADGKPDAFVASVGIDFDPWSGDRNNLLLSSPGGTLANPSNALPSTLGYTVTAAAGALNGGKAADIFVGNACCGEQPYLLINDGKGNFTKDYSRLPAELQAPRGRTNVYVSAALVDVNHDGFPDLILGTANSNNITSKLYLNNGKGSFADSSPILLPPGCFDRAAPNDTNALSITAGDLRGTGQQDLILTEVATHGAGYEASCIQILVNDGKGHFTDQTAQRVGNVLAPGSGSGSWYDWTFVADMNNDGYPDLIVAPGFVGSKTPNLVLLNDGHGFFSPLAPDFFPIFPGTSTYMIPVDLDGHGKIGFVQPYCPGAPNNETLVKFAIFQPIAPLPTPPPVTAYTPVQISSPITGVPITVSGTGCAAGSYVTPANLLWNRDANCTVTFPATPFFSQDTSVTGTSLRYVFAGTTLNGAAPSSSNPRSITTGAQPITINANFGLTPLVPPAQDSVLSFTFDPTQRTSVAMTPDISLGSSFTMEAWVSVDNPVPYGVILGKLFNPVGTNPLVNYVIALDGNGTRFSFSESPGRAGSLHTAVASLPLSFHTWTHVAAVLVPGMLKLYINGQLAGTDISSGPPVEQGVPFAVGGSMDGPNACCGFSGSLRQVRVWSRALSDTEIQTYASSNLTGTENGLLEDWPLDEGSGQKARNLVPNGPALTFLNNPSWIAPVASSGIPIVTGAANAGGGQPGIFPGSLVSIFGYQFASSSLSTWDRSIVDSLLPSQLSGVTVTMGGKPAYISAVTPGQINAQAPDVGAGAADVVVTTAAGTSTPFQAIAQSYGPAFFVWPNNQPVATHPDYSLAAKSGTFAGSATVPAKPGEVITLWGTGFGPTDPPVPAGQLPGAGAGAPTLKPVSVKLNAADISVLGSALSGYPGVYQIAIEIPSVADGDYLLVADVNGVSSPSVTLSIRQ
jgi:uncharacterized protein (TIGR03437 family)